MRRGRGACAPPQFSSDRTRGRCRVRAACARAPKCPFRKRCSCRRSLRGGYLGVVIKSSQHSAALTRGRPAVSTALRSFFVVDRRVRFHEPCVHLDRVRSYEFGRSRCAMLHFGYVVRPCRKEANGNSADGGNKQQASGPLIIERWSPRMQAEETAYTVHDLGVGRRGHPVSPSERSMFSNNIRRS